VNIQYITLNANYLQPALFLNTTDCQDFRNFKELVLNVTWLILRAVGWPHLGLKSSGRKFDLWAFWFTETC